ncbi:hypothetical protein JTE90_025246 [Oedothorax gibbosus]|uniref:1-alkyl-2-acetylglycerophosphocholine esterase n=1 Tax=Oedothorax gibbosus TaxID=931172 RepID=A0AAV6U2E3_9ARAC|nr:hypothetical protein JTE90_025246 [Oedothorax gibbosus]
MLTFSRRRPVTLSGFRTRATSRDTPCSSRYGPHFSRKPSPGDIHTPCAWDAAPLVLEGHPYPVLVFSHGLGGCRTTYTTFCLEMASRGIVVAALEHRDYSACMTFYFESQEGEEKMNKRWMLFKKVKSGKGEFAIRNQQVHQRARECSRALDMLSDLTCGLPVHNVLATSSLRLDAFAGLLDIDRACAAGHSFGGATVIAAMAEDKRFKAGLGLDTWMLPLREETSVFAHVEQPMLFVNMEKFQTKENLRVMKQVQTQSPLKKVVTLRGTVHLNQCDVPFLCDGTMRRMFGASSRLNRFTAMQLTTNLCGAFLSKHIDIPTDAKYTTHIQQHSSVIQEGITSV